MFEEHEKSMKKSMENNLATQQKKLAELRGIIQQKDDLLRQNEINLSELTEKYTIL